MRERVAISVMALAAVTMALAGCGRNGEVGPPPRTTDAIKAPAQDSVIAVPVTADLGGLAAALEKEIPRTLYTIDKADQVCAKSKKVKVAFVKIKTPTVKCDIHGTVTRGPLRFVGQGQDILVSFPVHADVKARDIGGILKQETATADAIANARMRITLDRNWNPVGKVDLGYSWTDTPHVEILGQRIDFTKDADKELRKVVARLERTLPAELGKLELRNAIETMWGKAFTSVELNHANPPVWMRVTPQQLQYGGYSLTGTKLSLKLGMKARTETFVGDRPADPPRSPLPTMAKLDETPGRLVFFIPVIADYKQLEPVVEKALVMRQARPFPLPGIGPAMAKFGEVEIYGTTGGKIAAGITFTATAQDSKYGSATGKVWLTGVPVNQPGSRKVTFSDVSVRGDTNRKGADLLLKLANSPGFSQTVATALAQNFENDYAKLMDKITRAISNKREGDLVIRAKIDEVTTGKLKAAGQGLYLPIWGKGTASIVLPSP